jgi:BirA family biotin operon repressor/biotin-[acetyl-CoA-carboxylase] ligase
MDTAHHLAAQGACEKTWVLATHQTQGRGRMGRTWTSCPGNFSGALILKAPHFVQQCVELGFVFCLSVGEALLSFGVRSEDLRYKWPNDILVRDRKIAGILVENGPLGLQETACNPHSLVGGVGVNLTSHPEDISFPATSLGALGLCVSVEDFTYRLCTKIEVFLTTHRIEGFEAIRSRWLDSAWRLGQEITLNRTGETVTGIFRGLDPSGCLRLQTTPTSFYTLVSGDVFGPLS